MKKKQFLDLLAKSLEKLPDDAMVSVGRAGVIIPFELYDVPYALIRIWATEVDYAEFQRPAAR